MNSNKDIAYNILVQSRKICHMCKGLTNPAEYDNGIFDIDHIGPWSRWQGNLRAKLMVVGQDWGDVNYFLKWKGFDDPNNPTNVNLMKLLSSIGINIKPVTDADQVGEIFLTNAILCLKQNGLQGVVDNAWFENCGRKFLRRTIEIVKPNVLVALGERAYKTILQAYGIPYSRPKSYRMVVEQVVPDGGRKLPNEVSLFPVYHCGSRGVNINRHCPDQLNDWKPIGLAIQTD